MFPEGFPELTTPGDIAAAGLGYVAGFVLAFFLPIGETEPAVVAGVFAAGCIGVKALLQAIIGYFQEPEDQVEQQALERRYQAFIRTLEGEEAGGLDEYEVTSLRSDHKLWQNSVLTTEEFKAILQDVITHYRDNRLAPTTSNTDPFDLVPED